MLYYHILGKYRVKLLMFSYWSLTPLSMVFQICCCCQFVFMVEEIGIPGENRPVKSNLQYI